MTCLTIPQNEGLTDRIIRTIIGSLALVLGFFWLSGFLQIIAYVIGVVSLATGLIGFCGLYTILGISTLANKKK